MNNQRKQKRIAFLLALIVLLSGMRTPVLAAGAAAVQLMKTEGTVSVTANSGRELSVRSKMKLYNGYSVSTQEASYAWLNLDDTKLGKVDALSKVEIRKVKSKLNLLIKSGNLYFNVSEPLKSDESMNIRTSTTVIGIRGTCGWVQELGAGHTRVNILEGQVECVVTDPVTGTSRTVTVHSGESADLYAYGEKQTDDVCKIETKQIDKSMVPGGVLIELAGDNGLREQIFQTSGIDLRDLTKEEAQKKLEEETYADQRNGKGNEDGKEDGGGTEGGNDGSILPENLANLIRYGLPDQYHNYSDMKNVTITGISYIEPLDITKFSCFPQDTPIVAECILEVSGQTSGGGQGVDTWFVDLESHRSGVLTYDSLMMTGESDDNGPRELMNAVQRREAFPEEALAAANQLLTEGMSEN